LRQYADERLSEAGVRAETQRRHLEHYLAVAEAARRDFEGADWAAGARRFDEEWDNLRAAVGTAVAAGRADEAGRLVDAACWYAHLHVRDELGDWARQAAAVPGASALAFGAAAIMTMLAGDYKRSISLAQEGRTATAEPTAASTVQCWGASTASHYFAGDAAEAYLDASRAVDAATARGDPFNVAAAVATLGMIAATPAPDTVAALAERARHVASQISNEALDAWVDCNLAGAQFAIGDRAGAIDAWRRAQAAGAKASLFLEAVATMGLATVATTLDQSPATAYREAISRLAAI
jgi:hypothetical protein